jgi:transglutaminase-like putative cysteine protease
VDSASNLDGQYLMPTEVVDSDHPEIAAFVETTVDGAGDAIERARRLFYAVRDSIVYDPRVPFHRPEHYKASNVLKWKRGFCVPKACLLAAAGRAAGIPSRLGFADIRNRGAGKQMVEMMGCDIFTYHSFVEFHLEGKWVKATPAFDKPIFARHNITPVEFDGRNHALYPATDLNGNPYVEYLAYHGSYADLPLEDLLESWRKHYGSDRVKLWIDVFDGKKTSAELSRDDFSI